MKPRYKYWCGRCGETVSPYDEECPECGNPLRTSLMRLPMYRKELLDDSDYVEKEKTDEET